MVRRSADISLDAAYVYRLIRQESRFVMNARSHVGASGLMQVMPARWTARKLGMNGFSADQLSDRDTNIAIGTGYLKLVLDDFGGPAGRGRVQRRPQPFARLAQRPGARRRGLGGERPFQETRDYVKKVLANTTFYAAMLTGQPQSLKARLGMVGPRDADLPAPAEDLP